jgi:hypothetical protein
MLGSSFPPLLKRAWKFYYSAHREIGSSDDIADRDVRHESMEILAMEKIRGVNKGLSGRTCPGRGFLA